MTLKNLKFIPIKEYYLLAGFLNASKDGNGSSTARAIDILEAKNVPFSLPEASTIRARVQKKGYLKLAGKVSAAGRGNLYRVTSKGLADMQVASAKFREIADMVPSVELDRPAKSPKSGGGTIHSTDNVVELKSSDIAVLT